MKAQKKINFRVTNDKGDEAFSMLPKEAVRKIKSLAKEDNKWCYINGTPQNTELLSEKELVQANDNGWEIILMNALGGGSSVEKPVEINFSFEKEVKGMIVDIEENDYVKNVTIIIGKDNYIDIIYDREVILKAIERKLNEYADREINGLKKALNK